MQKDLVQKPVASSSDGKVITSKDFARFRKHRLEQQTRDNPKLAHGCSQLSMASAEAAFIQTVVGTGGHGKYDVPVEYIIAVFLK